MAELRAASNGSVPEPNGSAGQSGGPFEAVTGYYHDAYGTASWVLPRWVDPGAFGSLLLAGLIAVGWLGAEAWVRRA
jgi:hypothetical protein